MHDGNAPRLMQIKVAALSDCYNAPMAQPALLDPASAQVTTLPSASAVTAGIVSRTLLQTPELRVVHFAFDAGQELTEHTSRRRALVHVLSGRCSFFFSGSWHELETGAVVHLPPDHPHALRASSGPFTMLLTLGAEPGSASLPS